MQPVGAGKADKDRDAQQKPQAGIFQADLPQNMKTGTGIIPHIPGERQVDQATAGELQRGNEHRATKTAMPQPFKMEKGVQAIKKQKKS